VKRRITAQNGVVALLKDIIEYESEQGLGLKYSYEHLDSFK
jgi:hypothetical protein